MNHPLISIIIPVYNSAAYISKCIFSIINQTFNNLEIIIINDGSTDSSENIILSYAIKEPRITYKKKENGGIGSVYKLAFELMRGDYVLLVDSDDWLELDAVEHLVKLAKEHKADMVSFGMKAFNSNGVEIDILSFRNIDLINKTNEAILKTHFEVLRHPTLARLYKRDLFKGVIVFEQNVGIDEMLTPQLLSKCNVAAYTSKVLYNVLIRDDSVCRSQYDEKKIHQIIKVYHFICSFMEEKMHKYALLIYLKYLDILISMFNFIIISKKVDDNNQKKLIINEIKKISVHLKNKIPLINNIKLKLFICLLINWPGVYELYFRLKKTLLSRFKNIL